MTRHPAKVQHQGKTATGKKVASDRAASSKPQSSKESREMAAAVDQRWMPRLDGAGHKAVARHWQAGSVRRPRRIVDAILRERDIRAMRN